MKPTDPDTVLTAMIQAKKLTTGAGQSVVLLTCDQQLYKIAVNITWAYPERFTNFILHLGGMHFLMNFIGCIGILTLRTQKHQISGKVCGRHIPLDRFFVNSLPI